MALFIWLFSEITLPVEKPFRSIFVATGNYTTEVGNSLSSIVQTTSKSASQSGSGVLKL
jgi:hypothetical protein